MKLDFPENYLCRYSTEIQAVHFGASHKQATLHDVVVQVGNVAEAIPMCTISSSSQQDPPVIWQYLEPVFGFLKENYPKVKNIHFFSDGPSTQYRQKKKFYLLNTRLFDLGFSFASWNFFEAGHGKGSPDGVGGSVKRTADRILASGVNIPDASTLFKVLSATDSRVKLFFTDSEVVDRQASTLPLRIPAVPGTMDIHQVFTSDKGVLYYRDVSCFCRLPDTVHCDCYNVKSFRFPNKDNSSIDVETAMDDTTQTQSNADPVLSPMDVSDPNIIGKWWVVTYHGHFYLGIITDADEEDVEVKCMSAVGANRFFWPMMEDAIWCRHDAVICRISEPQKIGSRHVQIDKTVWSLLHAN